MSFRFTLAVLSLAAFAGCASVPMASADASAKAKTFPAPAPGNAGLYIYRTSGVGGALKKDIWVDGKCIGESAPNVFFYDEVKGDMKHTIATQSEFSPNELEIDTVAGKLYFIHQYIKMGVFVGGANLELVDEPAGRGWVSGLELAQPGPCPTAYVPSKPVAAAAASAPASSAH